jgi:hypothetical protein
MEELVNSFNVPHSTREGAYLTVGARALSKHYQRSKDKWWGDCSGSDYHKNIIALEVLMKILNDAVWLNIHQLPVLI